MNSTGANIKALRESKAWTQSQLSEKSGLSVKTIQRLEKDQHQARGYSLQQLATAFEVDIKELQKPGPTRERVENDGAAKLKTLNLSALLILFFPFANFIFPFIIWYRNKELPLVEEIGGRIMSFQILWTLSTSLALIVTPFIHAKIPSSSLSPFGGGLVVYLCFWFPNLIFTLRTASKITEKKFDKVYTKVPKLL